MGSVYKIENELTGTDPKFKENVIFNRETFLEKDHVEKLLSDIKKLKKFWSENQEFINGSILQVNYFNLVAKSKRILYFFQSTGINKIVGSKYIKKDNKINLAIIYLSNNLSDFDILITRLEKISLFLDKFDNKTICHDNFILIREGMFGLKLTEFLKLLLELTRIDTFVKPEEEIDQNGQKLVMFYVDPKSLKKDLGIKIIKSELFNNSAILDQTDIKKLMHIAPYFVAQSYDVKYKTNLPKENKVFRENLPIDIGKPTNEPTIGVIDSQFYGGDFLDDWVDSEDKLIKNKEEICSLHANKVCSLIINGGDLNESNGLQDYCGHFKVKHFGILKDTNSIFDVYNKIKTAVEQNYKQIKVWNISLGTDSEIPKNFISPIAALLDELQYLYDVIFVIAATNKPERFIVDENYRIGSPADSINGLVVGSVRFNDLKPASYSRKGGVLDFFIKPDLSYFGGDDNKKIKVYNGFNMEEKSGTSFAAPFVTRKIAFLIYKAGMNKEEAKALLVHRAQLWNQNCLESDRIGRGYLPPSIIDVVNCEKNEIRFIYTSKTKAFYSDNYSLPIPNLSDGKSPFEVCATICYFTKCTPEAGVDYTNTEVDFKFGPVSTSLKSIKDDGQYEENRFVNEEEARKEFSKWDNTKTLMTELGKKNVGYSIGGAEKWGIKLTTTYRNDDVKLKKHEKYQFDFAIIVTLRSRDGVDRSDQFRRGVEKSSWKIVPFRVEEFVSADIKLKEKVEFVTKN